MSDWIAELRDALRAEFADRPWLATLATVDRDGHPHARTVFVRRVCDDGSLWVAIDARSGKACQVRHQPNIEITFWLFGLRKQYRVAAIGNIVTATDDDPRWRALWDELSLTTRATYYWPPPGQPLEAGPGAFPAKPPEETDPPVVYELLIAEPERVDCLDVSIYPHGRRRWVADGTWCEQAINP